MCALIISSWWKFSRVSLPHRFCELKVSLGVSIKNAVKHLTSKTILRNDEGRSHQWLPWWHIWTIIGFFRLFSVKVIEQQCLFLYSLVFTKRLIVRPWCEHGEFDLDQHPLSLCDCKRLQRKLLSYLIEPRGLCVTIIHSMRSELAACACVYKTVASIENHLNMKKVLLKLTLMFNQNFLKMRKETKLTLKLKLNFK